MDETSSPLLSIQLFGPMTVRVKGELIHVEGNSKGRWLLGYFALHYNAHEFSRARLAELFWPDSTSTKARGKLRECLSMIRKALGPDQDFRLLSGSHSVVSLNLDNAYCDVQSFDEAIATDDIDQLKKAVRLYQAGGLLSDWTEKDVPEAVLKHIVGIRYAKRRAYLKALDQVWGAALLREDYTEAIEYLKWAIVVAPDEEPRFREWMEAEVARGNPVGVLTAYKQWLHNKLDKPVSPEMARIVEGIQKQTGHSNKPESQYNPSATEKEAPITNSAKAGRLINVPRMFEGFILREKLIEDMSNAFRSRRVIALTGIGGIGKTELAIAFAHRCRNHYHCLFYLNVEKRENLQEDMRYIWLELYPKDEVPKEYFEIEAEVRRWLNSNEDWLLLLDNANDLDLIRPLLNGLHTGRFLITTQNQDHRLGKSISVPAMTGEAGIEFLFQRTHRKQADASSQVEETWTQAEETTFRQEAALLVEAVEGLTLSLEIAAATIAKEESISQYLEEYEKIAAVHRHDKQGGTRSQLSIYITFEMAYSRVKRECPAAANLLYLMAVLAPAPVSETFLLQVPEIFTTHSRQNRSSGNWNSGVRDAATRYSLVRSEMGAATNPRALTMHREVQRVLRDKLQTEESLEDWQRRAAEALVSTFPSSEEFNNWQECQSLFPHATLCAEYIHTNSWYTGEVITFLDRQGDFVSKFISYSEAVPILEKLLEVCKRNFDRKDGILIKITNKLATLYKRMGRFKEAQDLYKEALDLYLENIIHV